jgi:hypothetical protein
MDELAALETVSGMARVFRVASSRARTTRARAFLSVYRDWADAAGVPAAIGRIAPPAGGAEARETIIAHSASEVGLGSAPELISAEPFAALARAVAAIRSAAPGRPEFATDLALAEELSPLAAALAEEPQFLLVQPLGERAAAELAAAAALVFHRAQALAPKGEAAPLPFVESAGVGAPQPDSTADAAAPALDSLPAPVEPRLSRAEIAEAVHALALNTQGLLTLPLSGQEDFAARFALVRRKIVLSSPERMGRIMPAVGVLAHLWSQGRRCFLVVCPAADVAKWAQGLGNRLAVPAYTAHGAQREAGVAAWIDGGGVAITTYETLKWLTERLSGPLDAVIVDEARYVKNPAAQRSQLVAKVVAQAEYAVLLTDAEFEDKREELSVLVGYVQPKLAAAAAELAEGPFQTAVSPAYVRCVQEDSLERPQQAPILR